MSKNIIILALFCMALVNAAPSVQTGKFKQTYWSTGHIFEKDASTERTDHYIAKFREPFDEIPTVEVGLYGFDLAYNNAGIFVDVVRVAKDGLDAKITCPKGSLCYYVAVDFIAYVPGASFQAFTIGKQDFNAQQLNSWATGGGERYVSKDFNSNVDHNTGVITFISGFKFGPGANIRLRSWVTSVSDGNAKISFGTWADTKLIDFKITVLFFEKNEDTSSFEVSSDRTGQLFTGEKKGRYDYKQNSHIPVEGAQFFVAFNHIDFINGMNYRVNHEHHHGDDYLKTSFVTWWDTKIWLVKDSVLYTPY